MTLQLMLKASYFKISFVCVKGRIKKGEGKERGKRLAAEDAESTERGKRED